MTLQPRFVTDSKGKKLAVQLSVEEYKYLIENLEMKEDVALYEKVKSNSDETYMPLKDYVVKRKKKDA